MRIQTMAAMAVAVGTCAWAGEIATAPERSVSVCLHRGAENLAAGMAQVEASQIFAKAGVRIDWRRDLQSCSANDGSLIITLSYNTPATDHPWAWAYALPYEGTHIVVFWDRVKETVGNANAPHLLAYVLAHEITHVLQGTARHSKTGIMKASWKSEDFFAMGRGSLGFEPEDIFILHHNMDQRNARIRGRGHPQ
jgi:hypothetical protein